MTSQTPSSPASPTALARGSRAVGRGRQSWKRHQSLTVLLTVRAHRRALPLIVLLPAFNGFGTQNDWVGGFADAGVFVLLAVGLNVVVGLAGLLDLGYAAFFAIGAYTYAYGASQLHAASTSRSGSCSSIGRRWSPPSSGCCWARRRCACAATTWPS